jgi:hypothetical protein
MTGACWQGQRHLRGLTRPDGSVVCCRCLAQMEPPDPARAYGAKRGRGAQLPRWCR